MKTLRDEKCRNDLIERLENLQPHARPAWGKMNVEQMLSHLVHAGDLPFVESVPSRSTFFSNRLVKPLVLYLLPIPKEVKTSPEMDQQQNGRRPLGFEIDKANLIESIRKVGTLSTDHPCLPHPFFGRMSAKEWGLAETSIRHFSITGPSRVRTIGSQFSNQHRTLLQWTRNTSYS